MARSVFESPLLLGAATMTCSLNGSWFLLKVFICSKPNDSGLLKNFLSKMVQIVSPMGGIVGMAVDIP